MSAVHLQRVSRNSTTAISLAEREAPARPGSHMNPTQAFGQVIEEAVLEALKKALNVSDVTGRRLVTAKQAALYLCLSEREIYNMISSRELCGVRHGRRLMLDIRDLERWIETNKI
jgi:excisionase family DNA binding protein